jgi:hypothetical protein
VLRHLARCPHCREALRSLARTVDGLWSLGRSDASVPGRPPVADAVVGLLRGHWRIVYVASGAVLVIFGVLLATGELTEVTSRLARFSGVKL